MFCFQCQETAKNQGCTLRGVCGKNDETSNLMDLLIYLTKGIGIAVEAAGYPGDAVMEGGRFATEALFATITNANFDPEKIRALVLKSQEVRDAIIKRHKIDVADLPDAALYAEKNADRFSEKSISVGVLAQENEDIRSLQQFLIFGIKGLSAYTHHAAMLGQEDERVYRFVLEGLASTLKTLSVDQMTAFVMHSGECTVWAMELLDRANTSTYGNPVITKVKTGVRANPGILVSGHDLLDLFELLEQTKNTGVDVYTHSEMLPAHYYPELKKYPNLAGNYGGSWWHQDKEFASFNGPILMTTNCIVPVKDSYRDRIFTTGMAGYPGVRHIPDRKAGGQKDFSEIISLAMTCKPPEQIEDGEITGGFAHHQVSLLADAIKDAVTSGKIKRFIVMAGCDGRQKDRGYFTEVAEKLPHDTVILTAGCAKYRYNKLPLGDIGGIPRVLDAGQCNDSYSLARAALMLKDAFGLDDVNKLPISFDIAWYEQKAVAVLLALLFLGFKNIRLGPTLPAFLSPAVRTTLVRLFGIRKTENADDDVKEMVGV
ncbi:MAG: hydroxylamine reductase [Spirochaetaceae bacterium]|nr:MAG: hydroxylamine reductase [Spirochaetaceae bacterium]